ncbi:MAG: hypothetical protein CSA22_00455 [Deltaproteobacteria bacterium]|nr:MAG: hypothetical protein CSA22_00455 [Deltaproteobacteria bacterium]
MASPEQRLARYLDIEHRLNRFFSGFDYCLRECVQPFLDAHPDTPCTACCTDRYYQKYDLDTPAYTLLTRERVRLYGSPADHASRCPETPCEYHTQQGCLLFTHKSPICLSFMCRESIDYLRENIGIYTYDYLGVYYALEWLLTGDLPESERMCLIQDIDEMTRRIENHVSTQRIP